MSTNEKPPVLPGVIRKTSEAVGLLRLLGGIVAQPSLTLDGAGLHDAGGRQLVLVVAGAVTVEWRQLSIRLTDLFAGDRRGRGDRSQLLQGPYEPLSPLGRRQPAALSAIVGLHRGLLHRGLLLGLRGILGGLRGGGLLRRLLGGSHRFAPRSEFRSGSELPTSAIILPAKAADVQQKIGRFSKYL